MAEGGRMRPTPPAHPPDLVGQPLKVEEYGEWQTLHDELTRYMRRARGQNKEDLADYTAGMLDFVTGWCPERMRLDK